MCLFKAAYNSIFFNPIQFFHLTWRIYLVLLLPSFLLSFSYDYLLFIPSFLCFVICFFILPKSLISCWNSSLCYICLKNTKQNKTPHSSIEIKNGKVSFYSSLLEKESYSSFLSLISHSFLI